MVKLFDEISPSEAGGDTEYHSPPAPPPLARETGDRVLVTVIIAVPNSGWHKRLPDARRAFETWLVRHFGGFSMATGRGGWRDRDGILRIEPNVRYDIVTDANAGSDDSVEHIAARAAIFGRALDQEWVHVTSQLVLAHHIRTY